MRNFIDIVTEGHKQEGFDIGHYPSYTMPAGTLLFHGSNANDHFEMPEGPAWFTLDNKAADFWSGWHQTDPRNQGTRRVMQFEVTRDIELVDWRHQSYEEALDFAEALTGDPEAGPYTEAEALKGLTEGWIGKDEVMIIDPETCIRYIDHRPADVNAKQAFNR